VDRPIAKEECPPLHDNIRNLSRLQVRPLPGKPKRQR
jgi:hypothetical protein